MADEAPQDVSMASPPAAPSDGETKYGGYSRFEIELEVMQFQKSLLACLYGQKTLTSHSLFNPSQTHSTSTTSRRKNSSPSPRLSPTSPTCSTGAGRHISNT